MLSPQARSFLEQLAAEGVTLPWDCDSAPQARRVQRSAWVPPREPIEVGAVLTRTIPGPAGEIPIRVYHPEHGSAPFPALVWMHGGCWVLGTLEMADDNCRALCANSGVAVVSVDYRLAPEHRFPIGLEDCKAAVAWIAEHGGELGIDGRRLAIGGDSAGGNLAAVVAQDSLRSDVFDLRFQLLVYPMTGTPWEERESLREFGVGHYLTREAVEWFAGLYARSPEDYRDPRLAPVLAAVADLEGLPPALVITAEYDLFRDEGEEYADRMREAGVEVELRRYAGELHSFFGAPARFDAAVPARAEAGAALREHLVE